MVRNSEKNKYLETFRRKLRTDNSTQNSIVLCTCDVVVAAAAAADDDDGDDDASLFTFHLFQVSLG